MKVRKTKSKLIIEYLLIALGVFIYSLGTNFFAAPHGIAPGGVTGFAIILYQVFDIPVALTNLIINVPLFVFAVRLLGRETGFKTIFATLALSLSLAVVPTHSLTDNILLAGISGGTLMGLGLGLVFYHGGTTGGIDLMGALVNYYKPNLKSSDVMLAIDFLVVVLAGLTSREIEISLYSLVTLYTLGRGINFILDGSGYSVAFYIVSDQADQIADDILEEIDRGVTGFKSVGMYTKEERLVLFTVVSRAEFGRVKTIVLENDPYAFVTTTESREVLGEGFTFDPEENEPA